MSTATQNRAPGTTGLGMTPIVLLATWQEKWGDLSADDAGLVLKRPAVGLIGWESTSRRRALSLVTIS